MLLQILNVEETEISLDGSKMRAGGRPAVSFYNPNLPLANRSVAKSLLACTGFFGSNAAGECMPSHWQLSTAVMAAEREKIRFEFLTHVQNTCGRFGYDEERIFPATIRTNEKGGMTDVEFDSYIKNSVIPLFPDLADRPG